MTLDELIQSLPEDRREAVRQRAIALITEEKWRSDAEITRRERMSPYQTNRS
jgi:hypothetical protein